MSDQGTAPMDSLSERDIARVIIAAASGRAPIQVRNWLDKHALHLGREVSAAIAAIEDGWEPRIGEQVVVNLDANRPWMSDWVDASGQPLLCFVVAMRAIPSGGIDVTVSEEWPLKRSRIDGCGGSELTDGFIVGREGEQNDLAPLPPPPEGATP